MSLLHVFSVFFMPLLCTFFRFCFLLSKKKTSSICYWSCAFVLLGACVFFRVLQSASICLLKGSHEICWLRRRLEASGADQRLDEIPFKQQTVPVNMLISISSASSSSSSSSWLSSSQPESAAAFTFPQRCEGHDDVKWCLPWSSLWRKCETRYNY